MLLKLRLLAEPGVVVADVPALAGTDQTPPERAVVRVLVSGVKGYAIVLDEALRNMLVAFDPSRQRPPRRLLVRTEFLPDVSLAPDGTLWLADRTITAPGIRIFDPSNDRELTARPIDVGLPPFALGFVP